MIQFLISIDPTTNRRRYYRIAIEETLIGDICVTRIYGRIGGFERRMAPITCNTPDQALRQAQRLVAKRLRKGYEVKQ